MGNITLTIMETFTLNKEEAEMIRARREVLTKRQTEQDKINAREAPRNVCMSKYNKQQKYNIETMFEAFSGHFTKQAELIRMDGKYESWQRPKPDIVVIAALEPTLEQNILAMKDYICGLELYTERTSTLNGFVELINKVLKDHGHSTFISDVLVFNRNGHPRCTDEYYSCFYPGATLYVSRSG